MSGVLDYLPGALRRAIEGEHTPEPRADCRQCPLTAEPAAPWAFHPQVRCCTYQPVLINVLAGRALRDGGAGAERVRRRMANPEGVTPWGIEQTAAWRAAYDDDPDRFGVDFDQRCPYWIEGEHGCSLWHSRPGVCRTWYCRHDAGEAGASRWRALGDALSDLEHGLADLLIELGQPDQHRDLADWFRWCAERAERLTDDELAPVVAGVAESLAAVGPAPEILGRPVRARPAISRVHGLGDRVGLCGYSPFDVVVAPRAVFGLLSRLTGGADLDDAVAEAGVDLAVVDELIRVEAIEPAD